MPGFRVVALILAWSAFQSCVFAQTGINSKIAGLPLTNVTANTGFDGVTLHFALHEEHPFVFFDPSKAGHARFSGVTIDLIDQLATKLNFNYSFAIDEAEPGSSEKALEAIGAFSPPGTMHSADVAAGAIHITTERLEKVHFSHSYFDTGYVVVVPRPPETINIWAFFRPFSFDLWICVIVELFIIATLFFLFEAPFLTVQEGGDSDLVDGKAVCFVDAIYWSVSALTGTLDKAPRTWAGKLLILAHGWFFLIIIASYTANLASVLTSASISPSITSWNDITAQAKQNKLAIPRGLTHGEFLGFETKHHGFQFDVDEYDRWEDAMIAALNGTNGAAATFHDLPMVQWFLGNDMQKLSNVADRCGLLTVGPTFAPVGYGFAFGLDSIAFVAFSQAIIQLKEEGEIEKIALRWGVGAKADAQIQQLCPLTPSTTELFFKDFHGLCIMTGAVAGTAIVVWALSKAMSGTSKAGASDTSAVAGADAAIEAAVRKGLQTALGDAVSSSSPAMQAYRQGLEVALRAGLQQVREEGGSEPETITVTTVGCEEAGDSGKASSNTAPRGGKAVQSAGAWADTAFVDKSEA